MDIKGWEGNSRVDNVLRKVLFIDEKKSEEMKIIIMYRYVSLIITSSFYMFGNSNHGFIRKGFIVMSLLISCNLLNYLYLKNKDSKSSIRLLVLIEIIGNSTILIPSGGINSPFVWYSLNTILITSIKLERKYSWINLFIYLFSSLAMSNIFINSNKSLIELIWEESNLILSLILMTIFARLLAKYISEIQQKSINIQNTNKQLVLANIKIKQAMNHTMKLYHAVDIFSDQKDRNNLLNIIVDYTEKMTEASSIIFSLYPVTGDRGYIRTKGIDENFIEEFNSQISNIRNIHLKSEIPIEIKWKNKSYLLSSIKSNYEIYGVLGIDISTLNEKDIKDVSYQLKFLSELASIALERFELEEVNERLLKTEEQNRIANEIHDGVLQRLFSISCGIFAVMKNAKKKPWEDISEELNDIRISIDNTMRELRDTIYGLSWNKKGKDNFIGDIKNYIDEVKKLNDVNIKFNVLGNNVLLTMFHKKALYRIIREAISNSIRHGKSKGIDINLNIDREGVLLEIIDDGIGFDIKSIETKKNKGIGLDNMTQLVNSLNGNIRFTGVRDKGTAITIDVPNIHIIEREEIG